MLPVAFMDLLAHQLELSFLSLTIKVIRKWLQRSLARRTVGFIYLQADLLIHHQSIKVKLEQDAPPPAPEPTPTPSASSKPAAKAVTITCVKGKTSKKVTAVKPKCPAGFKKK